MALSLLSAIQGAFQGPAPIQGRVTATSRATVPRALDVVVAPDAKPPAAKEELPDYMKSKRNLYPRKCDVMDEIENFVQEQIDGGLLLNPEKAWQPSDFLPDSQKPTDEWFDEVREMRKVAADLPDELLLVLIGDMITEEALPTYLTLLNTLEGTDDPTGAVDTAWGRWSRQWTSEENRHGDLLNRYLYLGGRVNMRSIEQTIMRLISSGFDPDTRSDPYRGFIYTSFQERATKISHGNVGKIAKKQGDSNLARICATIAGDEARHEKAYQAFVKELLARDPDNTLLAFADMMRGQITMPAQLMDDGLHVGGQKPAPGDTKLFASFSVVAQKLGVYTVLDYANIMEHLMKIWNISELEGLSAEAVEAQDYLCKLPKRYGRLAERAMKKETGANHVPVEFSWVNGRLV